MSRSLTALDAAKAEVLRLRAALETARSTVKGTAEALSEAIAEVDRLKRVVRAEKRRAFADQKPLRAAAARELLRKRLARRGFATVARRSA